MKITQLYSHLNGEEYLIARANDLYNEIKDVISSIDSTEMYTKISKEKTKKNKKLLAPKSLNQEFKILFKEKEWHENKYTYYISTNRTHVEDLVNLDLEGQRKYLNKNGLQDVYTSYKQTDFVKNRVAVEVQFGKYAFVAYDLFVKHLLFYTGGKIDVGVEILPTKAMKRQMSTGIAYFEGEVYNLLRQSRGSPPVPLLILGIEP